MSHKLRIGIVFGGRSAEHEVSLQSAQNVIANLDRDRFEPVLIGIGRDGSWSLSPDGQPFLDRDDPATVRIDDSPTDVALLAGETHGRLVRLPESGPIDRLDVLFPVLHGPYGEDGSIQGLARLANVPCVGPDILGSAVGMDKDVSKRLLRYAGIATAEYLAIRRASYRPEAIEEVVAQIGFPAFVKPANMGSSVGVSRVTTADRLQAAIDEAFAFDSKILVERGVVGREIECAVLGNDDPIASAIGEILPADGFYSYEAKYLDENGAALRIPAELTDRIADRVRRTAIAAFDTLELSGMARIDMFLTADDTIVVNEANTIPGFTNISMYPRLWQESGLSYTQLISRLIDLAIESYRRQSGLETKRR